jgi:predicted flap endonuclease-1-like 5' DNA nuclease
VIGRRHTKEDDIMGELSRLPNIGKAAERSLENAGIFTPEELRALGSKKRFGG